MKPVYCYTIKLWEGNSICYVNGSETLFPYNPCSPRQACLDSIDKIKVFALETGADKFMFGFRAAGIHNKAIEIAKADKDLRALEKCLNETPFAIHTQARDEAGMKPFIYMGNSAKEISRKFTRAYKIAPVKVVPAKCNPDTGEWEELS